MKYRIKFCFTAVLLIGGLCFPAVSVNAESVTSGTCGENLTWTLEDDTLTISGTGEMAEYAQYGETSPWYLYRNNISRVDIKDGVTAIGEWAFYDCADLESVNIPNSVISIGRAAFYGCTGLTSVTIPRSVESINNKAFYDCTGLTSVTIPDGVTTIEGHTFSSCTSLTSVNIPDSVISIGYAAFYDCSSMSSVTIPCNVESIDNKAFSGCTDLSIIYWNAGSISSLNKGLFRDAGIGGNGFAVIFGDDIENIPAWLFTECTGLKKIFMPENINTVGAGAFRGCTQLTDVYFGGSPEQWNKIGNIQSLLNANVHYYAKNMMQTAIEISETQIDVKGVIGKCVLAVAIYNNHALVDISFIDVSADVSLPISDIQLDKSDADMLKVFLLQSKSSARPLCESEYILINN